MAEKTPRFGCPKCKSDDISENNIVHVRLPVREWDEDGEPTGFGPWSVVDDTIRTVRDEDGVERYYCNDCHEEFEEVVRIETEVPNA